MLSRQVRCGASMHRAATLRPLGTSSRLSSVQSQNNALVRHYVVTRRMQPWRHGLLRLGSSLHERSLATAVDDLKFNGMPSSHTIPPFQTTPRAFDLSNFDPSLPLTIPEPESPSSPSIQRINTYGVPGGTEDMLAVFNACMRVHKLERASLVLKRLNAAGTLSGKELIVLNNRYLRDSLDQMRTTPNAEQAEKLHPWYELQIRGKGLPQTAETVACMLKASLLSERGPRLERLVRRYMGMAPGESGLLVLSRADILSDQDLAVITDICPTYNYAAEAEELEDLHEISLALGEQGNALDSPLLGTAGEMEASTHPTAFPEPVPTPQKGEGLSTLKQGLGLLTGLQDADLSKLPYDEKRDLQFQLERDSITSAISKWRLESDKLRKRGISNVLGHSTREDSITQQMGAWLEAMEQRLKEELVLSDESEAKPIKTEQDHERCLYGPILQQGDPSRLAAVVILTVLNLSAMIGADKGIAISKMVVSVGKNAQEDMELQRQSEEQQMSKKKRKVTFNPQAQLAVDAIEAAEKALKDGSILIKEMEGELQRQMKPRKTRKKRKVQSEEAELVQASVEALKESRPLMKDVKLQIQSSQKHKSKKNGEDTLRTQSEVADTIQAAEEALAESSFLIDDLSQAEQPLMKEHAYKPWSLQVKVQVGSALLKMLIESIKLKVTMKDPVTGEMLSQYQPVFSQKRQTRKGKRVGVLVMNPHLVTQLKKEPLGDFIAKHLPMLIEPEPWQSFGVGGFLDSATSLVRVKPGDIEQRLYARAAINNGDMTQVFKGLDVLGKTPWIVNKDVLNVMLEAWNTGEAIANFPPLEPDLEVPPEPDSSADPLLRTKWIKTVKTIENERSGLHSQRCFINLQLEVARAFRNQTIYFPHNVDYRGRAYPMPTYLNHMGADHARSLLKFGRGKELGDQGLRWLKIHLANLYGFDKASFAEREAFANNNVANIIDSASNPLGGDKWWLKAEDPWQCLSTCFELKAAWELPDPTKFISHLPIHQDGTCNGLQHYAALGGDSWGAKQVNLEPGDRPADVYSAVANIVKEAIAKDEKDGNPFAKALVGKITRKVVKQTVMTNVYGVTFAGAKKQVCKQIDALYPTLGQEVGIPNLVLSTYVAKHIFTALASMFRGAHDIQYWLGDVGGRVCRALTTSQIKQIADSYKGGAAGAGAKAASKAPKPKKASGGKTAFADLMQQFRSTVVWTTPLRMPVVQPYRKVGQKEIRTSLQTINFPIGDQTSPVNRRKQLQGFPPNFIHSLDASHMLLSALECHELGLDFAAVHDSFWTHACDIDVMNGVLREAFIRIHEEDVVGRLATEFEARHKGSIYLAHIDSSSPVAKKIKQFRKHSSLNAEEELLLEYKRNQLKSSANPEDQEMATKIVTPAAIYEEMSATEEDVDIKEDIRDIGLGKISEAEAEELAQDSHHDHDELMESDSEKEDMEGYTEALLYRMSTNVVEENIKEQPTRKRTTKSALPIWMPLTIPPIPQKGDFDVKRLRDSQYFFS